MANQPINHVTHVQESFPNIWTLHNVKYAYKASYAPACMARALSVVLTAGLMEALGGQGQRETAGQVP